MPKSNYKFINTLKNYAFSRHNFFIDSFFPISCLVCGTGDQWLCEECSKKINYNNTLFCPACLKQSRKGEYCSNCRDNYFLDGLWIVGHYNDSNLNKLIKKMKYSFIRDLAAVLATMANDWIQKDKDIKKIFTSSENILIPVPLHPRRLKWRGFNQSELICKNLAKPNNKKTDTCSLIKIKNNKLQSKLNKQERNLNIQNAYEWTGKHLNQKKIILIDDIFTTGATVNECAKVLKKAGASEVWALAIAKNML